MAGLGVRGLRDLLPQGDTAQNKATQYYNMAQGEPHIAQGGGGKSASGALMSGMGGAMAGAQLAPLIGMTGGVGAGVVGSLALGSYLFG